MGYGLWAGEQNNLVGYARLVLADGPLRIPLAWTPAIQQDRVAHWQPCLRDILSGTEAQSVA